MVTLARIIELPIHDAEECWEQSSNTDIIELLVKINKIGETANCILQLYTRWKTFVINELL